MKESTQQLTFKSRLNNLKELNNQIKGFKQVLKGIDGFKKLNADLNQTNALFNKSTDKISQMQAGLEKLEKNKSKLGVAKYKMFNAQMKFAQKNSQILEKKWFSQAKSLGQLGNKLSKAGINTYKLGDAQLKASKKLEVFTKRYKEQKRILKDSRLKRAKSLNVGSMYARKFSGGVFSKARKVFNIGGSFVRTASEFEQFETILTTIEGSSAKAKESMSWTADFAAKTPYDMAAVTDAFVKLKSYGLDPTSGLLKTLGDTSSAMGKPLMQSVEAIADAVMGENESLKEFGIQASTKGDTLSYAYTDSKGLQRVAQANKNDRKQIEKILTQIWGEKFGGGMDKQSKTFSGMMSNMADTYAQFQMAIMNSGGFDALKAALAELLEKAGKFLNSEEGKKFVSDLGMAFRDLIVSLVDLVKFIAPVLVGIAKLAANNMGAVKTFGAIILAAGGFAFVLGKVLSVFSMFSTLSAASPGSLGRLGSSFIGLIKSSGIFSLILGKLSAGFAAFNLVVEANPLGAIILGITAVIGLFIYLEKKFGIFSKLWNKVAGGFKKVAGWFGFGGEEEPEAEGSEKQSLQAVAQNNSSVLGKSGTTGIAGSEIKSITGIGSTPSAKIGGGAVGMGGITINISTQSNASAGDIAAKVKQTLEQWRIEQENKRLRSFV